MTCFCIADFFIERIKETKQNKRSFYLEYYLLLLFCALIDKLQHDNGYIDAVDDGFIKTVQAKKKYELYKIRRLVSYELSRLIL